MADIEARTGIAGTLLARCDDASTWMETYAPTTRAATFRRVLDVAGEEARCGGVDVGRQAACRAVRRAETARPAPQSLTRRRFPRSHVPRPDRVRRRIRAIGWSSPPIATNSTRVPPRLPAWWHEGFLAGRDLEAGGTWLGVDRRGRFALLTNVRDPSRHDPGAPSRGALVPNLLAANAAPSASLPALVLEAARCNGFNLIAGDRAGLMWGSNRAAAPRALGPGIYGVSNHLLDTPWPKARAHESRVSPLVRWRAETGTTSPRCSRSCTTPNARPTRCCRRPASRSSASECCRRRSSSAPTTARAARRSSPSIIAAARASSSAASIRREALTGEVDFRFAIEDRPRPPSAGDRSR